MNTRFSTHQLESLESRRLLAANLLADVTGIYPTDSAQLGGISYFAADDGVHGKELWKSDGTQAGTVLVADILPGSAGSNPTDFIVLRDAVLFIANKAIYRTDESGTTKLADVGEEFRAAWVATLNGKAVFVTRSEGGSVDLWTSDGSVQGTVKVINLYTESGLRLYLTTARMWHEGAMMQTVGDRLLYADFTGRLFSTDGTAAGTVALNQRVGGEHQYVRSITVLNDVGLFLLHKQGEDWISTEEMDEGFKIEVNPDSESTFELWRTDGTLEGTERLLAMPGGGQGWLEQAGGRAYFVSTTTDSAELWMTDGTDEGTQRVTQIPEDFHVADMTSLPDGGLLFVLDAKKEESDSAIWITDGTVEGTNQVASLGAGATTLSKGGVHVEGSYYFLRYEPGKALLWRTDGTAAGTALVQTFNDFGVPLDYSIKLIDGKVAVTTPVQTYVLNPLTANVAVGPNQGKTTLTDRVLRIFGTRGDDSIRIYRMSDKPNRFVVNLNGVKRSYALGEVRKIIIYGYSGDDNIAFSGVNGIMAIRSKILAGSGNDSVYGGSTRDSVWGEDGDDFIHASVANDEVFGGMGDDTLLGTAGADTLNGEEGADSVIGGSHQDVISGGFDQSNDILDGGVGKDVIFGTAVFEIFFGGEQGGDPLDDVLLA